MKATTLLAALVLFCAPVRAQLYMGMSGLINTPSADMHEEGDLLIGGYYMDKHFTPGDNKSHNPFYYRGEKYNTADFYISVTPFKWVEVSYAITLFKTLAQGRKEPKLNQKDRYISAKINPLREGKYYPAIAIGATDMGSTDHHEGQDYGIGVGQGIRYFSTYYVAATKHFKPGGHNIGVNIAYRYCPDDYNKSWQGVVGGVTWQPKWVPQLRAIAEFTGNEVNVGLDCLLWHHLFMQAVLQDGKHFSAGAAFKVNLF